MQDAVGEVTIFRSSRPAECRERALVLSALGLPHAIRRGAQGEWRLVVRASHADQAAREIESYSEENDNWPRRAPVMPRHRHGLDGVVFFVGLLVFMHLASHSGAFGLSWFGDGRMASALLRDGEWWRAITALTLHVGPTHIIGNLILGSILGLFASRQLGSGLAWLCILCAGTVGNVASGILQADEHTAVGASTAVFAALGLVGAFSWRHRHERKLPWAVQIAPLIVVAVILNYTGSGGERTDVLAHLTGFVSGLIFGALAGGFTPFLAIGRRGQWLCAAATLGIVAGGWGMAFVM